MVVSTEFSSEQKLGRFDAYVKSARAAAALCLAAGPATV
jgi:hypothetical protein